MLNINKNKLPKRVSARITPAKLFSSIEGVSRVIHLYTMCDITVKDCYFQ